MCYYFLAWLNLSMQALFGLRLGGAVGGDPAALHPDFHMAHFRIILYFPQSVICEFSLFFFCETSHGTGVPAVKELVSACHLTSSFGEGILVKTVNCELF